MIRAALFALLAALAACDGALDAAKWSQDPALLVGAWDLESVTTPGMLGPSETIPADRLGYSLAYVFEADGAAEVYRDGALSETTTWAVETFTYRDAEGRPRQDATLRIGTGGPLSFGVDGPRLYFDDRPADGNLQTFRRR